MKPDIAADARGAFDVIKAGGSCIFPVDVGYTFVGGMAEPLRPTSRSKTTDRS